MQQKLASTKKHPSISTVEEKVHLEDKMPFQPKDKIGPTVDLFFHELAKEKGRGQKILRFWAKIVLSVLFLLTFPFIGLFIKIFSRQSVLHKTKVPGRRGTVFQQYTYPTTHKDRKKTFWFGTFLKKSGLYKLPSVINMWKGQMNLVGPQTYPANWCNAWNKKLSDCYKRFALPPGYVGVAKPITDPEDLQEVSKVLKKELDYVLRPSLKSDLKHLFGVR